MGQTQSAEGPHEVSTEQLSHELALRFATKCYTHLEIAHFKDNFKTLADHQDGIEYWKEETLCQFLSLPESLQAGSVLYQMCTYLGAFPFPSLAPCILTRQAMLKTITIMTGKYRKILKRGHQDKVNLLFRSLAVFDRRASVASPTEKPAIHDLREDTTDQEDLGLETVRSKVAGFAIDEPSNEDEEEDDDDLVLAALDTLNAIEVFKHDQKTDRKIHHAHIPAENLKRLVMLVLALAPLSAQENVAEYAARVQDHQLQSLERAASGILQAFDPDPVSKGVRYKHFVRAVSSSMPFLFDPLTPLFDHFLFSKNIDLSKHKALQSDSQPMRRSPIVQPTSSTQSTILNDSTLAQISTFNQLGSSSSLYQSRTQLHQIYSTNAHGTSLSSFGRQVLSWSSSTLLLLSGTSNHSAIPLVLGAYLPEPWRESSFSTTESTPILFQLQPRHSIFPANPYNKTTPTSYYSAKSSISLGCLIPALSRTSTASHTPVLGPVSLLIDPDMQSAIFQHDADAGTGAYLTDPGLEAAQKVSGPKKIDIEIETLEVWGISFHEGEADTNDELTRQRKRLDWEDAEAARRRAVNFGGDKNGARALLEMAGLVGHEAQGRTGGSV